MSLLYEVRYQNRACVWERNFINFLPHLHDSIEIVLMAEGSCVAHADFKDYPLRPGDVFITFPNQIHSYTEEKDVRCYLLILPPNICPPLSDLFDGQLPDSPVIRNEQLYPELFDIAKKICLYRKKKGTGCTRAVISGCFSLLLGLLLEQLSLSPVPDSNLSTERGIIRYCTGHFREKLTLEQLEKDLFISRYHISHLFSSRMRISFNDFLNQLRVDEACRLLESGCSVSDAAFNSGFSSIRTFNRVFLKDTGKTPKEYQKCPSPVDR